ncbi:hypothetical protein N1851_008204 [Merluccius polli]|uniref:Uncharacterized protein n=1 Tax=Merluccius polli TaxID=89951 RepID=A0AA47N2Z0_MERPO|nr:hypothetical protein N1851_008204 [Merluccius polli]
MAEPDENPVEGMREQAARLRAARSGKVSHLTRRMNIVNNLLFGRENLDEVKGNMRKFEEVFDDFNRTQHFYASLLDEDARKEDDENWWGPRSQWISRIENPTNPILGEVTSSTIQVEEPPVELIEHDSNELDADINAEIDNTDAQTVASHRSSTSSTSLRVNAEAERLALITKASKLKEKHAIEEQEAMLRKRRETLELDAEIEATTVKIKYLKDAEMNLSNPLQPDTVVSNPVKSVEMPVLGAEAAEVTSDTLTATHVQLEERMDSLLHPRERAAPSVRPKTGAQAQFINLVLDRQPSRPIFQHRANSDIRPQPLYTSSHSFPSALHPPSHSFTSHSYPSANPSGNSQSHSRSDQATRSSVPQWQIPTSTASQLQSQENDSRHTIKVLENQNQLTRMLVKRQLLSSLPQGNIPPFDGQVLEYK